MDITIKGVPEEVGERQVQEWVAVLIERFENSKLNQIKAVAEATSTARTNIDAFRTANALQAKFAKEKVVQEAVNTDVTK